MTVESLPWAIQGQSHIATIARNATAAMMGAPSSALVAAAQITTAGGSHGVVLSGDLAVTQNGSPNMSVNVAAGRCFVRSQETLSLGHGTYTGYNDATVNVSVAASDPTNPRRDLVIFQVRDSNYSGASTDARITVVTGTPAASPVDPTVPVNSLVLARIAVAASSTTVVNANITDLRTRAYALGGIAVCTSTTRPSAASLYAGLQIYETDTARLLLYTGSSWATVSQVDANWITSTGAVAFGGSTSNVTSTFRYRRLFGSSIQWECEWSLSGAPAAGNLAITSPVGVAKVAQVVGQCYMEDFGTGQSVGDVIAPAATIWNVNLSRSGYLELISNTTPFSWAAIDSGVASGLIRVALG